MVEKSVEKTIEKIIKKRLNKIFKIYDLFLQ
jgi:hypothetical protein